ncbi:sensor histidine kinase [Variovorax sp. AFSI2.2]|uniref:sensor histidine kinase n=1 Tax=Variovorax sp. AFSI2.2 TaxID=3384160 RepID=UPI003EBDAE82
MSMLAVITVIAIALAMWLRFAISDARVLSRLPPDARQEMQQLRADPHSNASRLWQLFEQHYDVVDFLPGVASRDWWLLAGMVSCAIPVIVLCGLYASRPLSRQFTNVADAARLVSEGDFSARASVVAGAPDELIGLAVDFNGMTAKLQQYEREVRESSAMVAHELRTPLNAAMGRVQGMLDQVFSCDETQLSMVYRQLEQLNFLVGDLHLLSLARAGQLSLEREEFLLDDLVQERLAWAAPRLNEVGLVPRVSISRNARVTGDRDRIGQVLLILIDNAIRYAGSGKHLSIDVIPSNSELLISVCDRGPGVDPDALPRMTERFWRAEHSRDRHLGGSGLGLSIAAAICQAHGGLLELVNRTGGGLCAHVHLPLSG